MRRAAVPQETKSFVLRRWAEGATQSAIAAELRKTPNSVAGIINRAGQHGKRGTVPRQGTRMSAEERNERRRAQRVSKDWGALQNIRNALKAKANEAVEMPKDVGRPAKLKKLSELNSNMCREPFPWGPNDPDHEGLFGYCGARTWDERKVTRGLYRTNYSYCKTHYYKNYKIKGAQ